MTYLHIKERHLIKLGIVDDCFDLDGPTNLAVRE